MTPHIVNGLHYKGAPFCRVVRETIQEAFEDAQSMLRNVDRDVYEPVSILSEPMSNGYSVTINLEPQ